MNENSTNGNNPLSMKEWKPQPGPTCLARIRKDLMALHADPLPAILVFPDEKDITVVHALVAGPFDTPYEGGFFYFVLHFPWNYPVSPPHVRLMTTGGGNVRFNPNLYSDGKVCLSILGTWDGPGWSPVQTLSTVLISIQSLMGEEPYYNEPGRCKRQGRCQMSDKFNEHIRHETLRVAVVGMLEGQVNMPTTLRQAMENSFLQYYQFYEDTARANLHRDGQTMRDQFNRRCNKFQYGAVLRRLKAICARLDKPTST